MPYVKVKVDPLRVLPPPEGANCLWTAAVVSTATQWAETWLEDALVEVSFKWEVDHEVTMIEVSVPQARVGLEEALDREEELRELLFKDSEHALGVRVVRK